MKKEIRSVRYSTGTKNALAHKLSLFLPTILPGIPGGSVHRPLFPRDWTTEEKEKQEYRDTLGVELCGDNEIRLENLGVQVGYRLIKETGGTFVGLWIDEGFTWDGASGPTWDTKSSIYGSCVHDALYAWIRNDPRFYKNDEQTPAAIEWRKYADAMLYKCLVNGGMWRIRARMWYRAVRRFGGASASPANRRKEHVVHVQASSVWGDPVEGRPK